MVNQLIINDNTKSPLSYLPNLDTFKNGTEYTFKHGVNIIVGENGCGKTTLLKLLKRYLLVDFENCDKGAYNKNLNDIYTIGGELADGVDVYADYKKNTFRLCHFGEKKEDDILSSFNSFGTHFSQLHSSTGENVLISIESLFEKMFTQNAQLYFDYSQFEKDYPKYYEYVKKHTIDCENEWTTLMDEPDRNLSLDNLQQIQSILSFHKPNTQIITVIHNPLLIYSLAKDESVNIIEMTPYYVHKIQQAVRNLLRG